MRTVYVFNCFAEIVSLSVGGYGAGPIAAWADGKGAAPIYTPVSRPVPRIHQSDAGGETTGFVTGDNAIRATWDSLNGVGTVTVPAAVGPPPNISFDADLILHLYTDMALLLDDQGFSLGSFPLSKSPRLMAR